MREYPRNSPKCSSVEPDIQVSTGQRILLYPVQEEFAQNLPEFGTQTTTFISPKLHYDCALCCCLLLVYSGTPLGLGQREVTCPVLTCTNRVFGTVKCVLFIEVSSFQGVQVRVVYCITHS